MPNTAREELRESIDAVEGAYEFFLAYAAQGIRGEQDGVRYSGQLRQHLDGIGNAVSGLGETLTRLLSEEDLHAPDRFRALAEIVSADAARAGAIIEVVRAQPFATSQLVDNLNASVHVRTHLTDLFLVDEALGLGVDGKHEAAPETSDSPA
jgi:hypothetical protein